MHRLFALLIVTTAAAPSVHAQDNTEALTCASCDPQQWIDMAREEMGRALYWDLSGGDTASSTPGYLTVMAEYHARLGTTEETLRYARAAAASCVLSGESACRETMALLGELTAAASAGDEKLETEALAYLSLVPYDALSPTDCASALTLRYRLNELHTPRLANPKWADNCGNLGRVGEVGYRAAKAALIRGEWDDAAVRLDRLRAFGHGFNVRASYFRGVLAVARDQPNRATRLFEAIVNLPPDRYRTEEEDDARILAALQLARLYRMEGRYEDAIETYRRVPSRSAPRADAILESAVVAAHMGNLHTARAYLDALAVLDPQAGERLEVRRLRANLAVIDGDPAAALETFRDLTALGRKKRQEIFAGAVPPDELLKEDPTLGGLLEGEGATRVAQLEKELGETAAALEDIQSRLEDITALVKKGRKGPLERAIERLEEADAMLRRAERTVAQRQRDGVKLAGPATPALKAEREARALRSQLNRHLMRLRLAKREQDQRLATQLDSLRNETKRAHILLATTQEDGADTFAGARKALVARADELVMHLEMSEDVGMMELAWRKKRDAELEVKRVRDDFEAAKASLQSDANEKEF